MRWIFCLNFTLNLSGWLWGRVDDAGKVWKWTLDPGFLDKTTFHRSSEREPALLTASHEINWGACHSMQALPWSQAILLNFNFEVGVHAYVVNAYVNGIIVESHFKAVRWTSFSSKSNQDWWCQITSFSYSDPFPQGEFLPGLHISNHRFGWIGLTTSSWKGSFMVNQIGRK